MLKPRFNAQYFVSVVGLLLLVAVFVVAGEATALPEMNRFAENEPSLVTPACPIQVAVIQPTKDNTIFEAELNEPMLSNGAGDYLFAGNTAGQGLRRALISFDVAGFLPSSATIYSPTLELYMSKTIVGNQPVSLHRVLADWGEGDSDAPLEEGGGAPATIGDATWQHSFYSTILWPTPGGIFSPTASAIQTIGFAGSYTWEATPGMLADVQDWYQDPDNNFGWILIGNESALSAKRFDSRENPNINNRPTLNVPYSAPNCTFLPITIK